VKAVFFDAGGTLVHIDYPRVAAVVKQVLGQDIENADFVAAEYEGRAAVEAGMATGDLPTDTSRWSVHFRAMLRAIGLTDDEFDAVAPAVLDEHKRRHLWSGVVPGTAEALRGLAEAGYLVGVISNADGTVEKLLAEVGLREHLAFVIDSGKVGVEKPDARIFRMALDRGGMGPADCYYVGDIYPIDVVGSRDVGMVPILLDPLRRYGARDCRTIVSVPEFCRELVSAPAAA
jgi:HAD superfamily hydrolase (TIGR01549 family)